MLTCSTRSMARWIVALPVLMVGSLLYWSLALSLGGISLMRAISVASPSTATVEFEAIDDANETAVSGGPSGPILVHLQESAEPQDLGDATGTGGTVDPDVQPTAVEPVPGHSAY